MPKLGSGHQTHFGQLILDPIWAVDTRPNLGTRFRNFTKNNHATFLLQGLDLPNERMPPRKDAPATPEAASEAADGGNDEASKANNSNG